MRERFEWQRPIVLGLCSLIGLAHQSKVNCKTILVSNFVSSTVLEPLMKRLSILLALLTMLLGGCVVWPWGPGGHGGEGHDHDRGGEMHHEGGENRY